MALARRAAGSVALIGARAMQMAAAPFERVAQIANTASRALQGVHSLKRGSLIGGLANVAQGFAGGIAGFGSGVGGALQSAGGRLADVGNHLSQASAVFSGIQGYRSAQRGLDEARRALRAAETSGDPRAIAQAREQLEAAERTKSAALLGGAASLVMVGADAIGGRAVAAEGPRTRGMADAGLESHLRMAAGGLGLAAGVVERDWAAAAASGLGLGAAVEGGREGRHAKSLNEAANVAQATLGYERARRAESQARGAVEELEVRLETARRSGSAEAIRQAEAELARARQGVGDAVVGSVVAADSLLQTAAHIGAERERAALERREAVEAATSLQGAERLGQSLAKLAGYDGLDPEARAQLEKQAAALAAAEAAFLEALDRAQGDAARIEEATEAFQRLQDQIRTQGRRVVEDAQTRAAAARAPNAVPASAPASAPAAAPSRPVGVATVRPGMTVWEVSMRTGVPVERILEFNAQTGNALVPESLQVGQRILVPLGAGDVQATPKTAAEVQRMIDQANLEKRFEGMPAPRLWPPEVPFPFGTDVADGRPPGLPPTPTRAVEEQRFLDFIWRDFDWRSVGQTAFNAAADIGDSVGAFAKGFGSGVVDMAKGAVLGSAELAKQGAKLSFGSPLDRFEAAQALWDMSSAAVDHAVESGRLLAHGVTHPGDVLDAMAQLGIKGSAEQLGRATVSAEGTVSSLYGMVGGIRSLGQRIASETDEAAEAAGRTSSAAAGETIGTKASTTAREIRLGDGDVIYKVDELGRTVEVDARITGPHRGRPKGHRPDPPGGLTPGEHRGHLAPEGGAPDPRLVNVPQNIISEAPSSNLGPKKAFDNLLSRLAAQNPGATVRGRHRPVFKAGENRPYAVEHRIFVNGKEVYKVVIPNK
jgi:LysM repeat protein